MSITNTIFSDKTLGAGVVLGEALVLGSFLAKQFLSVDPTMIKAAMTIGGVIAGTSAALLIGKVTLFCCAVGAVAVYHKAQARQQAQMSQAVNHAVSQTFRQYFS